MRSWILPSTSTAIASRSNRSPIDRTTSLGNVPRATVRVAPSGSVSVISSDCVAVMTESDRSIMGVVAETETRRRRGDASLANHGNLNMLKQWRHQPRVAEEEHDPDNQRNGDSRPEHEANDRCSLGLCGTSGVELRVGHGI